MPKVIVVGTSHISRKSMESVKNVIRKERPDCVAIELCPKRYYAMLSKKHKLSLKFGILAFVLSYLQQKLAKHTGILPGSEMLTAVSVGKEVGAKIVLIDVDILETLERIKAVSLKEKLKLVFGFLFTGEKINIEAPEEKTVKQIMRYMRKNLPEFYNVLVKDRNLFMAQWIKKLKKGFKKIVVVVGLGHKEGLEKLLKR